MNFSPRAATNLMLWRPRFLQIQPEEDREKPNAPLLISIIISSSMVDGGSLTDNPFGTPVHADDLAAISTKRQSNTLNTR